MILENVKSKDGIWIKQKIGEWISHKLIYSSSSVKKELISIKELNEFDREKLASDWFNAISGGNNYQKERMWNVIEDYYDCSSCCFVKDIAIYIDKRLVQAYIKAKDHYETSPSGVTISLDTDGKLPYGLEYKYTDNYADNLSSSISLATEKQIKYLESLARKNGYYFSEKELTKKDASSFINYFKNVEGLVEPKDFNRYFINAI